MRRGSARLSAAAAWRPLPWRGGGCYHRVHCGHRDNTSSSQGPSTPADVGTERAACRGAQQASSMGRSRSRSRSRSRERHRCAASRLAAPRPRLPPVPPLPAAQRSRTLALHAGGAGLTAEAGPGTEATKKPSHHVQQGSRGSGEQAGRRLARGLVSWCCPATDLTTLWPPRSLICTQKPTKAAARTG